MSVVQEVDHSLENIQVGGEVELITDKDLLSSLVPQGGSCQFKEIDRGCVTNHYFVIPGADQLGDPGSQPGWHFKPAFVPALYQAFSPLFFNQILEMGNRIFWQSSQRITIQIDQIGISNNKPFPETGQWILVIKLGGIEFFSSFYS